MNQETIELLRVLTGRISKLDEYDEEFSRWVVKMKEKAEYDKTEQGKKDLEK